VAKAQNCRAEIRTACAPAPDMAESVEGPVGRHLYVPAGAPRGPAHFAKIDASRKRPCQFSWLNSAVGPFGVLKKYQEKSNRGRGVPFCPRSVIAPGPRRHCLRYLTANNAGCSGGSRWDVRAR
jgi:hypothetical protein